METIHLSKKKIVELNLNGMECQAILDNRTIEHFQKTNKTGFIKALEALEKDDITVISKLLGSLIREKATGRILGYKYFTQYDAMDILTYLSPILKEIFPQNMPEARDDNEKK